jgi:pyridoxamine 5'-phosphate oxidase family protein
MMGTFTDAEIAYLNRGLLGHLATVGPDGRPHVVPLGVWYDPSTEALVIGGYAGTNMAASKKFRDARRHPDVAVVVDDADGFVEVRGRAETHTDGGEEVGTRLGAEIPFDPAWILIRPRRIVAMGVNSGPEDLTARDVATAIGAVHVYRIYIQASPTTVWEAIVTPEWTERNLMVRGEFELHPGGSYRGVATGNVTEEEAGVRPSSAVADGKVIEVDPPRKLVHTWRVLLDPRMAEEGFTRLTWELQPVQNSPTTVTKLTVTHDAADAPRTAAFASGQREPDGLGGGLMAMLSVLKTALETGTSPVTSRGR